MNFLIIESKEVTHNKDLWRSAESQQIELIKKWSWELQPFIEHMMTYIHMMFQVSVEDFQSGSLAHIS